MVTTTILTNFTRSRNVEWKKKKQMEEKQE